MDCFLSGNTSTEAPYQIVDSEVDFFVDRTAGPCKTPVSRKQVAYAVKPSHLFWWQKVAGWGRWCRHNGAAGRKCLRRPGTMDLRVRPTLERDAASSLAMHLRSALIAQLGNFLHL